MEELTIRSCANLVNHCGFQIDEHAPGDVLARSCLREECVEGIIATANSFVGGHLTIRLDAMLEAEELPAGITNLDTCLTEVDANNLTHLCSKKKLDESNDQEGSFRDVTNPEIE